MNVSEYHIIGAYHFYSSKDLWLLMLCLSVMGLSNCLLYVPAQDIIFKLE